MIFVCAVLAGCREQPLPQEDAAAATVPIPAAHSESDHSTQIALQTTPEKPEAQRATRLAVAITGSDATALEPIAGQLVHVFAVTRDLSWHEHIHPKLEGDSYVGSISFPAGGEYVVYAIYKPRSSAEVVTKWAVAVNGSPTAPKPLQPTASVTTSGAYTVRLRPTPDPPSTTGWNALRFTIEREGEPVTDLTPTGSLGHIVILREGAEEFSYAHSTDGEALAGVRARLHVPATPIGNTHERHQEDTGPDVTFHTRFSTPGRHKIWAGFTVGADEIDVEFVVDVGNAPPSQPHEPH